MFSRHQGFGGCLRGNASAPTWERWQDKWEAVGWECSCPSWTPRARGLFPKPGWFTGYYETWAYWIVFFCVDYTPKKSSCILEDHQTFFVASTQVYVTWGEARILVQGIEGFLLLFMFSPCQHKKEKSYLLGWFSITFPMDSMMCFFSSADIYRCWKFGIATRRKQGFGHLPCLASPPPGGTREQPRPSY